jgi:hypothetical protein
MTIYSWFHPNFPVVIYKDLNHYCSIIRQYWRLISAIFYLDRFQARASWLPLNAKFTGMVDSGLIA